MPRPSKQPKPAADADAAPSVADEAGSARIIRTMATICAKSSHIAVDGKALLIWL